MKCRVAEVSLLGALGGGAQLLQLIIDELETGDTYDLLVLQATDNAIGFYIMKGNKDPTHYKRRKLVLDDDDDIVFQCEPRFSRQVTVEYTVS